MTGFLSYATRKNSRTRQTASRKVQVWLKQKYTLKREMLVNSESYSLWGCLDYWFLFTFGEKGLETWYLQWRWYYNNVMIRQSWIKDKEKTPELYPGGKRMSQGHLACLPELACFSCWSLTLGVKTARGLNKEQGRHILKGTGNIPRLSIFPHFYFLALSFLGFLLSLPAAPILLPLFFSHFALTWKVEPH